MTRTAHKKFLMAIVVSGLLIGCTDHSSPDPKQEHAKKSPCAHLSWSDPSAYAVGIDSRNEARFTGGYARHGIIEEDGRHVIDFSSWSDDGHSAAVFLLVIPSDEITVGPLEDKSWEFEGQDRFWFIETREPFDSTTSILKNTERANKADSKIVFEDIERVPEQPYGRTCGRIVGTLERESGQQEEFEFLFQMNPDFICADNEGGLDPNLNRDYCSKFAPDG